METAIVVDLLSCCTVQLIARKIILSTVIIVKLIMKLKNYIVIWWFKTVDMVLEFYRIYTFFKKVKKGKKKKKGKMKKIFKVQHYFRSLIINLNLQSYELLCTDQMFLLPYSTQYAYWNIPNFILKYQYFSSTFHYYL